ncbi:hypothetical protein NPIL_17271 [Nephila pilipes]|uniref:Uncharacterized protein n=1 Tax=Nephila pilipes TaxID=299642 RepID=A0A8X6P9H7_NEPPI|nr:hypothetical protein NPIL_17271 [Nephila pilipes]
MITDYISYLRRYNLMSLPHSHLNTIFKKKSKHGEKQESEYNFLEGREALEVEKQDLSQIISICLTSTLVKGRGKISMLMLVSVIFRCFHLPLLIKVREIGRSPFSRWPKDFGTFPGEVVPVTVFDCVPRSGNSFLDKF